MKTALLIALVTLSWSQSAKCEEASLGRGPASLVDTPILVTETDLKKETIVVIPEQFQGPTNLLPDVDIELMDLAERAPQE